MAKFSVGDKARFIMPGSPVMLVVAHEAGKVVCQWFAAGHVFQEAQFKPDHLDHVPAEPEPAAWPTMKMGVGGVTGY